MEEERRNEEESSHHLCIPFQFINEALNTFLNCIGFHISPSTSSPSSEEATNEVVPTTRGLIVKSKGRPRETASSGKPGRRN
ncbi:elicitor peptide 2 [Eutrema salsugineum]|uniref:elicitor peptide 2 n=1 Tax=Eutrema salsugineum TaxID=72664 RepID=UPI000CED2ECC|nr:elicitor peptide 2 [Eutrema salsugineum]